MRKRRFVIRRWSEGFSLVEVIVALGIAAFCLVSMLGLIPTGLKAIRASNEQTAATALMVALSHDLKSAPLTNGTSPRYRIPLKSIVADHPVKFYLLEDGERVDELRDNPRYAASVALEVADNASGLATAAIRIHWPAAAPFARAQGSVETVIGFNRN